MFLYVFEVQMMGKILKMYILFRSEIILKKAKKMYREIPRKYSL